MTFTLTAKQEEALDVLGGPATHVMLEGGSRSGKTAVVVRSILIRALAVAQSRHAILRFRFNHLKGSIIYDTLPKMIKLCWPGLWEQCKLDKTDWFFRLPNGSEIWFGGLDDKERTEKILGSEFATLFFNECSQIPWASRNMAVTRLAQRTKLRLKAYYDANPASVSHWSQQVFTKKINPDTREALPNPENYARLVMNPVHNLANLPEGYIAELEGLPERQKRRFLYGLPSSDTDGALWTLEGLDAGRILDGEIPDMQRIIISIDPSGCSGPEDKRSDEVGIIVLALGVDGRAYVLEDLSGRHGPQGWGRIVVTAFERYGADCVVGEGNFGGAMVKEVIRAACSETQRPMIPFKMVHASRGKVVRAEPVAALYGGIDPLTKLPTVGKVSHVGRFPRLEDQLISFSNAGYVGDRSPDRADACLVAGTVVATARGDIPIESVTTNDRVLTRLGFRQVVWSGMTRESAQTFEIRFSNGKRLYATAEHPIYVDGKGFIPVDALTCGDIILTCKSPHLSNLSWMAVFIDAIQTATGRMLKDTICPLRERASAFITAIFGRSITAQFLPAITSTTRMGTSSTTSLRTMSASPLSSTGSAIVAALMPNSQGGTFEKLTTSPQLGMPRMRGSSGIECMGSVLGKGASRSKSGHVPGAGSRSRVFSRQGHHEMASGTAQGDALNPSQGLRNVTWLKKAALSARSLFSLTNIGMSQKRARVSVERVMLGGTAKVYNLHVDGVHEFYANGILVHNCIWGISELFPALTRRPKREKAAVQDNAVTGQFGWLG